MLKFNNNNIFTGYIKQLLSSFELPTIRVAKNNIILIPGQFYIYNDNIIQLTADMPLLCDDITEEDYIIISSYSYGDKSIVSPPINVENSLIEQQKRYIPYTKTLENKTLIYDSYTHKYLGEYLRFMKDYQHLDLMSLYNCFSNTLVNKMDVSINNINIHFNSNDNAYKIYKIPIRFFEKYTIAIDSSTPVEILCGFDCKDTIKNVNVLGWSYKRYNRLQFNTPVLYTCMYDYADYSTYVSSYMSQLNKEQDLVMFIKVASKCNSSIVVLEGDYVANSDFVIKNDIMQWNRSVINIEGIKEGFDGINLLSSLQLLKFNSGVSYPFADRLIEYLLNNTVDSRDKTTDNIKRVQKILSNKVNSGDDHYLNIYYDGVWEENYRYLLYGLAIKNKNMAKDTLGYYDKDIEQLLGDVDIYPDISDTKTKNKIK